VAGEISVSGGGQRALMDCKQQGPVRWGNGGEMRAGGWVVRGWWGAGNVPEQGEADVDEEVGATARDQEDADGGYCGVRVSSVVWEGEMGRCDRGYGLRIVRKMMRTIERVSSFAISVGLGCLACLGGGVQDGLWCLGGFAGCEE
jgi:hypothetical protein